MTAFLERERLHMRSTLLISIALLTANLSQADSAKLSRELEGRQPDQIVDVIIQYKHVPTAEHHARVAARGGELKHNLDIVRAAHYSVRAETLDTLANDPDVEFISPDHPLYAASPVAPYTGSPDYGWKTVGADLASSVFGVDGTGIGIAMVDSGVNDSNDLKDVLSHSRIVYKGVFIPGLSADDRYQHGTHVSGILAGNGANSISTQSTYSVRGIAPNANLISLKALNNTGVGTDSAVIAAIQQAIALKSQYNIRVLNLSLGRPVTTSYVNDPLCQAVAAAWKAGIVVVVAASNDGRNNTLGTNGYGTINAPGNSPYVITVGAMNTEGTLTPTDDKIATYSSKGPTSIDQVVKPDIVAPGNRIISIGNGGTYLEQTYPGNAVAKSVYLKNGGPSSPDYFELSGTSMATPMVAGAAALMIQKNPSLTPDQVKARLMKTATKFAPGLSIATDPTTGVTYTDEFDIFTIGAGYLNIPAALANNDVFNGAALSPTAVYNAAAKTVSVAPNAQLAVWGTNSGTFAVWGTGSLSGTLAIWGTVAVWGTSVFADSRLAVWGTGTVWGTCSVSGTTSPQAFSDIWGKLAIWGTGQASGETVRVAINGDN